MTTRTRTDTEAATGPISLRPSHGGADLDDLVEIFNAANRADHIDERLSRAGLGNWLLSVTPTYDPQRDLVVAELGGRMVGYGGTAWVDTTDGRRDYVTRGMVHPDWRRRGVGAAILRHNEARLRELSASHDTERERAYLAFAPERRIGAVALLTGSGYQRVRYFFDMVRPTLDGVEVPALPEGLELRPIVGREGLRRIFDADAEAFMDHWGGFDASDQSFERWAADPDLEPEMILAAWDGDQIAGAVVNIINVEENRQLGHLRGLLDSVFVRRPWRGRGLGYALVMASLALLRDRGMTSAVLGVDADNPSGALRLYEKAGFAVDVRSTAYRKPMEMDR